MQKVPLHWKNILFDAIVAGDEKQVQSIISTGADVNSAYPELKELQSTFLIAAVYQSVPDPFEEKRVQKKVRIVKLLLNAGANPRTQNHMGKDALYYSKISDGSEKITPLVMEAIKKWDSLYPPSNTPYVMPPEWAVQDAVWISWPKDPLTFDPETILPEVEKSFSLLVKHLSENQMVNIFVNSLEERKRVLSILKKNGVEGPGLQFQFVIQKTQDVWLRDYGPTFVMDEYGNKTAIKWIYNGYGKYEELATDTEVFEDGIPYQKNIKLVRPGIVLEGGSIEVNGAGICLTTKQCLLNKNRNPTLTQAQIEEKLRYYLGVTKILWLNEGIVGDDTDGHVDDIARFVDENTIVYVKETDKKDPNYAITQEIEADLKKMTDANGKTFKLVAIPMPKLFYYEGRPLPASYANFYIGNNVVLVPTFNDENDAKAITILQKCFTGRKVIGIPARAWVHGLGTIHCSTQQEPAGNKNHV